MNNAFVCLMGMGTVFIGLICIIVICLIMSLIFKNAAKSEKKAAPEAAATASAPVAVESTLSAQEKQKIIAGTCAVIAEELGTDVSNIRVLSFKRI